jgi:Glycosyl transferase family 2
MLSVVIATQESERALVPTLAALVAGAVAGLVREVIIADGGSEDASTQIAEEAGCRVLISPDSRGARLSAAAKTARAQWLLFLTPGTVPGATWIDECQRFIEETDLSGGAGERAATFRQVSTTFRPLLIEALALLRAALTSRAKTGQGLLIAKPLYHSAGGHRSEANEPERELMRRLGRRIVLLRTGAMTARYDT